MPSANPTRQQFMAIPREGSPLRPASDQSDVRNGWKRAAEARESIAALNASMLRVNQEIARMRRRILGAPPSTDARWQTPLKELDPSVAVSSGTWVYVSPNNPLVTTGLTDLDTDANAKATPGIWEAVQDVPAKDGSDKYHVPQADLPGATGTPSGTPLSGDADGADVYWIPIGGGGALESKWCKIQAIKQDHYEVKEWDWDTSATTGDTFNVAKPYEIRGSRSSITVNAVEITYDYGSDDTFTTRTATDGTYSQFEDITPPFEDGGSLLFIIKVANTGVTVDGSPVLWLDSDTARAWTRAFDQPS